MPEILREFNFLSVCVRLLLALLAGGVVGFGRARKQETAGLRTYIITSVGAALTALISFYVYEMLNAEWVAASGLSEVKFDGGRYASGVISGIGFLAAGSIMIIVHQQVSGLTTAIGLFVSACVGIAAGMGFYEAVLVAVVLIVLVMEVMHPLEIAFKRRMRNMTIHVSFERLEDLDRITGALRNEGVKLFEVELEQTPAGSVLPSVILTLKLARHNTSHSAILSTIAELPCVNSVQELIS